MKTIKLVLLAFTLSFTFISCEKYAGEDLLTTQQNPANADTKSDEGKGLCYIWVDNFDSPLALLEHWRVYGNPSPEWKDQAYGRNGLFDNNGPSPVKNYAVSNTLIGRDYGYVVESEVMLKILNPAGTCVCPGIAVTKPSECNPVTGELRTGISMRIIYAGATATWFPAKMRNHTWFIMDFISENGTVASSGYLPADNYSDNWFILRFEVTPAGFVRFFCDETLLWAPLTRLNPMMYKDNLLVLGYTSDGDPQTRSGVAYHNWVKASFSLSPKE
ncbi:MAG: hypothetical protein IPH20_14860 [Bacteroidales bacterium]|nr:hypothetical protein [Bacteroidales bacterium]